MFKVSMVFVFSMVLMVSVSAAYRQYGEVFTGIDSFTVVQQNFSKGTFVRYTQDSAAPTNYCTGIKNDTESIFANKGSNNLSSHGGWTLLEWVKFGDTILSYGADIPIIDDDSVLITVSANGRSIGIRKEYSTIGNRMDINNIPYFSLSSNCNYLFDGYFHLIALSFNDTTKQYFLNVDDSVVAVTEIGAYKYPNMLPGGYYVGDVNGTTNAAPIGLYVNALEILSRPITESEILAHYDSTITMAFKHHSVISQIQPNLTAPLNGDSGLTVYPTFTWDSIFNANYDLQIATDSNFKSIVLDTLVAVNTFHKAHPLNRGVLYYWRVQPINCGDSGIGSKTFSFVTVGATAVEVPTINKKMFDVFPNPCSGRAMVSIPSAGQLTVYDVAGRLLKTLACSTAGNVSLSGLNNGVVFIRFGSGAAQYEKRLVVVR